MDETRRGFWSRMVAALGRSWVSERVDMSSHPSALPPEPKLAWSTAVWTDARIALCDGRREDPDRILLHVTPGVGVLIEVDDEGATPSRVIGDPLVRAVRRDSIPDDVFDQLVRLAVLEERVRYVREWGPSVSAHHGRNLVEHLEALGACDVTLTLVTQDATG